MKLFHAYHTIHQHNGLNELKVLLYAINCWFFTHTKKLSKCKSNEPAGVYKRLYLCNKRFNDLITECFGITFAQVQ